MGVSDWILTALTPVIRVNHKLEEMAGPMKEQQRRLNDPNGHAIRLETALKQVLNRSFGAVTRLSDADGSNSAR